MTRLVLLGLWVVSFASSVRASDLDLDWAAPAHDCPDREQLRAGLSRRLAREVSFGSDAPVHVVARVEQTAFGYSLTLHTRSARGDDQRTLRARNCNELARASVLIVALLFPDHGGSAPLDYANDADDTAAELDTGNWRWHARAEWVVDLGALPLAAFGPGLAIGVELGPASLELGGFALLPRAGTVASHAEPIATLRLTAAVASACLELVREPALAPCLALELGQLQGSGRELPYVTERSSLWLMPSAGVRASLPLTRWLRWSLGVALGLPWDRSAFTIRDLGLVHQVPNVVGRLTMGLELGL
jgi:hypothetical protein